MYKYIFLFLLLFTTTCNAHVSGQQAVSIYQKMIKTFKLKRWPRLEITGEHKVQARSNGYVIQITRGMLNALENKDELAIVIGHELWHYLNEDYLSAPSFRKELDADRNGFRLARGVGANACRGLQFMVYMKNVFGNDGGDHPDWDVRYDQINSIYHCS